MRRAVLRYGVPGAAILALPFILRPNLLIAPFAAEGFIPQGSDDRWQFDVLLLHAGSDILIGSAYVAISATLTYLVYRIRRDIPFHWVLLTFGLLLVASGATHWMEVWTLWHATSWLAGALKLLTAVASVATALALPRLVPRVVEHVREARITEGRKRQLEGAHRDTQLLVDRIRELDRLKTRFFASVSHELRTPITLVLGPTRKLLDSGTLSEDVRRELELVDRNARLLLKHVNDLLDVAKIEAGRMGLDYGSEASSPGAVSGVSGTATLSVQDDGPGVRPEQREAIFEAFRRGDAETPCLEGTGLGLAIVKEFAELHGGSVRVDEAPGGGALFTVRLPLAAPPGVQVRPGAAQESRAGTHLATETVGELHRAVARAQPETTAPGGDAAADDAAAPVAGPAGAPLVLVAEDNAEMRAFIARSLEGEYRVATACDGREGLARALALRPDLIVTDLMMPRYPGEELLRELRARPELAAIPVVILSAKEDDELRVRLLREGAQDYLVKPFAVAELRARVANLVAANRARELLQRELDSTTSDLAALAGETVARNRELEAGLAALRRSEAEKEAANRARDEFLAAVSHELRTPVQAVLGWATMLRSGTLDGATAHHALEVVERNARSQAKIVEDILDVSSVVTGKLRLELWPVDLIRTIEAALDTVRPAATAKSLRLSWALDPWTPLVAGDPARLQQVVWNLLSNAVKFTPRGGRVEVRLQRAGSHVEIVVADTGMGIHPEFVPHVFERFCQADSSTTRSYGGLGLGLAIVRHLVELHGGTVGVASEGEGRGATFTVTVPVPVEAFEDEEPDSRAATPAPPSPLVLEDVDVLVVDDEADARDLVKVVLQLSGARVTAVGSCAEALEELRRHRPEVLVSDIAMPGQNGYDLIQEVQTLEAPQGRRIPAVALTAFAGAEDRARALSAGYQVHVAKPVDPDKLVSLVASLIGRASPG